MDDRVSARRLLRSLNLERPKNTGRMVRAMPFSKFPSRVACLLELGSRLPGDRDPNPRSPKTLEKNVDETLDKKQEALKGNILKGDILKGDVLKGTS